jgi:hypothetical protein
MTPTFLFLDPQSRLLHLHRKTWVYALVYCIPSRLTLEQTGQVLLDEFDHSVRSSRHLQTLRQRESLQLWAHDFFGFGVDALGFFWCPHGCGELTLRVLSVFCLPYDCIRLYAPIRPAVFW